MRAAFGLFRPCRVPGRLPSPWLSPLPNSVPCPAPRQPRAQLTWGHLGTVLWSQAGAQSLSLRGDAWEFTWAAYFKNGSCRWGPSFSGWPPRSASPSSPSPLSLPLPKELQVREHVAPSARCRDSALALSCPCPSVSFAFRGRTTL